MSEDQFKFGGDRCLSVWIIHGGVLLMILIIAPGILVQEGLPDLEGLIFGLGFPSFIFVPHTFLFMNHLKYEKETVVILRDDQISISKHNIKKNFKLEDIIRVEQYEAVRSPWMIIVKWKIVSSGDEVTISSLTFPRTMAWRLFGNKIDSKTTFFPSFP